MISKKPILLILVLSLFLMLSGCSMEPQSDDTEDVITYTAPPENLLGTIALNNGKSAILDMQFETTASNASIRATGTVSVSGNVRYDGENYIAGGIYNDETRAMNLFAENTTTGLKFIIIGTYTPSEGFTGTVTLYSGTTVVTEGSISAADATDNERDSITLYTGTYGGDASGTWNGTLTDNSFYGTWASYDGEDSGSVAMTKSGNTLSFIQTEGLHGTGFINGSTLSGSWNQDWSETYNGVVYTGTSSGSWSGAEVDNNYDSYVPTASSDAAYLSNIILQTFENAITLIMTAIDNGQASAGTPYENITVTEQNYDSDSVNESLFLFANYIDSQTGLSLSGQVLIEEQPPEGVVQHYYIDSDVSDFGTPGNDDGGLIITFQDATTIDLFVDAAVDSDNETITKNQFANPVWELGGTDVLSDIYAIFF
ncbi:MAG: hypothetical protein KAQ93_04680 [Spirochaetales bacterium]|nr:hypothetical protein [Spirochaetales bacterium]